MIAAIVSIGYGSMKNLSKALGVLAKNILNGRTTKAAETADDC
jgi:hypothetical protein